MNNGDEYLKVKKITKRLEKIVFGIILLFFTIIMLFCLYIIIYYIIQKKPKFDLIDLVIDRDDASKEMKVVMDIAFDYSRTVFGGTFCI
jgi:hypothetical protein